MYVFICSVYLNQPPKLEPAEFVKPCVIIVYVVNTSGLRLGLVYTVAVPCTSFLLLFVAVARTIILFVLFNAMSSYKWCFLCLFSCGRNPTDSSHRLCVKRNCYLAFCKCFSERLEVKNML